MERTISAMIGKGSVNHNTRAFTAKNVDKNRSVDNVEFCQEDIKQVYHKLFDEARERYNAKQKRKDRMIDNYYEKIRRGKQEKLFHEVIFQIGNKDDMNAKNEDGLLAKRILMEFMDEFQARNPNLYVFSAHLHMDEETPHLHIDFVPYITGSKRGLDTRVSLKSALAAEGFTGGTRGATELNQWIASEKQELATVMERYGVEWLQKGTHEKHFLIICADGLTGIKEAIAAAFPKTEYQRGIVHQVRNTLKYVPDKDRKAFATDLKTIYQAADEQKALAALNRVTEKWTPKYPNSMKSWKDNWDAVSPIFKFSTTVRKVIYTTNAIESLNSTYRKLNRQRSVFPSDTALLKALYLSTFEATKKWTTTIRDWGQVYGELSIMYEGRLPE